MTEKITWPELPEVSANDPQANVKLELYKAQLDLIKAHHQAEINREKDRSQAVVDKQSADYANEFTTFQEVYKGYIEVAKKEIDRSLQRADFVQKVAAAIATAYASILALSFSVAKNTSLPVTGIAPTLFLGLSFFLAAVYVSYLTEPGTVKPEAPCGTLRGSQLSRRNTFILWTRRAIMRRKYFLQASVVSLGIGIFFLPAPYLDIDMVLWLIVVIGIALTFLVPLIIERPQRDLQK